MFTRLGWLALRSLVQPLSPLHNPFACRSLLTRQLSSRTPHTPPVAMSDTTTSDAATSDEPIISIHRSGQLVEQGTHSQLLQHNGLYTQLARQSSHSLHSPPQPPNHQKLLWLDLEMTGLDESVHRILEVAVVITDITLRPHARYHATVRQSVDSLEHMSEYVRQMHTRTGLLDRLAGGRSEQQVEAELCALVDGAFGELGSSGGGGVKVLLAGNTVHMDRRFIRRYWPELEKRLHYRIVDVSSWKEVTSHTTQHTVPPHTPTSNGRLTVSH